MVTNPYQETIRLIASGDLAPATLKVAVQLLALANEHNGMIRLPWDDFLQITACDNRNAARRHLTRLVQAGACHYETNGFVRVDFLAWAGAPFTLEPATDLDPRAAGSAPNGILEHSNCAPARRWQRAQPVFESTELRAGAPLAARNGDSTYTHARAGVSVCLSVVDPNNKSLLLLEEEKQTDRQTAFDDTRARQAAPDQTEQALSVALLLHIGIKPLTIADRLAKAHPFEHIRQAVGHWYMNRAEMGGQFKDTPQIVIYWLNKWDDFMIPSLSPEFRQTDLYAQMCKTPAERRAERAAERAAEEAERLAAEHEEQIQQAQEALASGASVTVEDTMAPEIRNLWPIMRDELYREMAPETFNRFVKPLELVGFDSDVFTFATGSVAAQEWLGAHLAIAMGRKLTTMVKRRCTVIFTLGGVQ